MSDFITVESFSPRIQMAPAAIYRAIRERTFPFPIVKIGRLIRIDVRSLNAPTQPQEGAATKASDSNHAL